MGQTAPRGRDSFKFNDKDIYPGEIGDLNKSQTLAEQMQFSDFATSESDLSDEEIIISYGFESTVVNEEVTLSHYDSSSLAAKNVHLERLVENDAVSSLEEGHTDNPSIENLISGTDLFGADLVSIPVDHDSQWHSPLSENIFFDTALVYSSHEFISSKMEKSFMMTHRMIV